MSDVILVINAGSSSIKFSVFRKNRSNLVPDVRGQVEGLYTSAHFISKAPDGTVKAEKSWPDGTILGHDDALDHLIGHFRSDFADDRLTGIGHRVVNGGLVYTQPVYVDGGICINGLWGNGRICPKQEWIGVPRDTRFPAVQMKGTTNDRNQPQSYSWESAHGIPH